VRKRPKKAQVNTAAWQWAWCGRPKQAEWLLAGHLNQEKVRVNQDLPRPSSVCATFDRAAERYHLHDALEREVSSRLLERLEFQRLVPQRIMDLGAGTGHSARALKRQFPRAEVIALDVSLAMCRKAQRESGFFRPLRPVCADFARLPFAGRCADLLFSNLAMQWRTDFAALASGFRRVLRTGGLLVFSTLGPGSLQEFRHMRELAGQNPSTTSPVRPFPDMHDIGDALLAAGFAEPVVDSQVITTEYRDFARLLADLEWTGASTHISDWPQWTAANGSLATRYEQLRRQGGLPVTWEIVFGAAFGPPEGQPIRTPEGDVAAFSIDSLRGSRRPG
jgi:malonyl-CoA O-methyltransferase